jgi:regulator of sigma E protease
MASDASLVEVWGNRLYNILLVALGLGFVIFVHELGHFLAAKLFGVKCEKFYVGFDVPLKFGPIQLPSKLAHFQWGETEYGIGIIPLGGYVKMLGQDDDPRRLKEENERIRVAGAEATNEEVVRPKLDPRSYPAKPVFARMIIISAGVVMNLIFGVLMAAIAFWLGVPYDPAVVGSVLPGDPAWKNGLQAGDKIVQVGSFKDDQLSFSEMRQKVAIHGIRDPKSPVHVVFERDGQRTALDIVGTSTHAAPDSKLKPLSLGVRSASTMQLGSKYPFAQHVRSQNIELGDLQAGDRILAVNGTPLESSPHHDGPLSFHYEELVHPHLNETVSLTVERKHDDKTSTHEVDLKPMPLKTFGIRLQPDRVSAVAKESVAEKAGVQVGDRLVRLNGSPIEDAFTLPFLIAGMAGKTVELELVRDDAEKILFQWTVPERFQIVDSTMMYAPSGLELPGSGLVYPVSNVISGVVPGSVAEKNGFQVGDKIKQIQLVPRTEQQKEYYSDVIDAKSLLEKLPVDSARNMQFFLELTQWLSVDMPLVLYVERDSKVESGEASVLADSNLHWPDRGLALTPFRKKYQSDSVMQSLSLGVSEIWRRLGDVFEFLQLLVTGKALNFIGGPGTIAVQATDAASQGISPLLMFLTLLSANLAIVNFLPIPALDGGHMVFLIAEAIRGKPVDEELQMRLTLGGVLGLLSLMAWAIFNDYIHLSRYFGG